jgi:hypothetical protein
MRRRQRRPERDNHEPPTDPVARRELDRLRWHVDSHYFAEHIPVSGVLHLLRRRQLARRHGQSQAEALMRQGDIPVYRLTVDHHDPEGPPGRAAPQLMDQLYAGHASPEDQHVTIGDEFFLRHIPPEGAGCPRGKDTAVKESLVKAIQSLMRVTLVVIGVSAYRSDLLKLDGEG